MAAWGKETSVLTSTTGTQSTAQPSDWLIGMVLSVVCGMFALWTLIPYNAPDSNVIGMFNPAIMLASGKGFVDVDPDKVPGMRAFLNGEAPSFSPESIPVDTEFRKPDKLVAYRRYIIYFVAGVWRVFGITWGAMKLPMTMLYAASCGAAYALFRLGMGRGLSVVATLAFAASPAMIMQVSWIRDFSKAPFILAALALIGYCVKYRVDARALRRIALALGVVIGIGIGFRQDVVLSAVPALAMLLIGARGTQPLGIRSRLSASLIFLVALAISGGPILVDLARAGSGESTHQMVMGLSTPCNRDMGVVPASYELVNSQHDYFVFATINAYARRTLDGAALLPQVSPDLLLAARWMLLEISQWPVPGDVQAFAAACGVVGASFLWEEAERTVTLQPTAAHHWMYYMNDAFVRTGRKFLLAAVRTFPADTITRAYACVARSLGEPRASYAWFDSRLAAYSERMESILKAAAPVTRFLERFKWLFAAATLLLIAGYDLRTAWVCLLLLLYFGGYTVMQYAPRHAFYLTFIPLWMVGFLLTSGWKAWALARGSGSLGEKTRALGRGCARALLFTACAGILLVTPLAVARPFQHRAVESVLPPYASPQLTPVATERGEDEGWVLFRVPQSVFDQSAVSRRLFDEPKTAYLMAECVSNVADEEIRVVYDHEGNGDFTETCAIPRSAATEFGTVRYFFPVYQDVVVSIDGASTKTKLRGIAMRPEWAGAFKGLYRVTNERDFPFLLNIALPQDMSFFRWHYGLPLTWQRFLGLTCS